MDSVCVRIVASGPSLNKMVRNDNAWWWVASTPNTQYVCTRGVKLRIYVLEVLPTYPTTTTTSKKKGRGRIMQYSTSIRYKYSRTRRRNIIISSAPTSSFIIQNKIHHRSSPNNIFRSSSSFYFIITSLHHYVLYTTTHTYALGTEACRTLPMPHRKRHCIKVRLKTAICF